MITALDHIALVVGDLDGAVTRYEALLGRQARGGRFQLSNTALTLEAGEGPEGFGALGFAGEADPGETHGVAIRLVRDQSPPPSPFVGDEAAAVSGLDHLVINTPDPERAIALYGGRLGLDLRLDRANPDWGMRLLFFRCGGLIVEIAHALNGPTEGPDSVWGLTWRVPDIEAAHARLAPGFNTSEVRAGRKPGTRVFTVRDAPAGVPTLILAKEA
jgi:catechol 2,3-dioxygenase-like lactoylglutathione lyase family enzyme